VTTLNLYKSGALYAKQNHAVPAPSIE